MGRAFVFHTSHTRSYEENEGKSSFIKKQNFFLKKLQWLILSRKKYIAKLNDRFVLK